MTLYVIQIKFNFRICLSFFWQYSSKCKAKVVVYRKGWKIKENNYGRRYNKDWIDIVEISISISL